MFPPTMSQYLIYFDWDDWRSFLLRRDLCLQKMQRAIKQTATSWVFRRKPQLLQAVRVTLTILCELNHLSCDHRCKWVLSVNQAEGAQHVFEDVTHHCDHFRFKRPRAQKSIDRHPCTPRSHAGDPKQLESRCVD